MSLVPNPNWSGDKPKLDQINIKFVPDPETALAALKTGDVDMNPDFAESDIPTISALEPAVHLRVDTTPPGETVYIDRRDLGPRGNTPRRLGFAPGRGWPISKENLLWAKYFLVAISWRALVLV